MRLETGGMIDRETLVTFTFDGKSYQGFAGDTLASALLANGVKLLGRSFKYHRPRGVFTTGSAEPNALVTIGEGAQTDPNIRATMQEIFPGMVARSQNNWPSLRYDVLAINDLMSPFLGAGFYYKTFMWPAAFWEKVYEPIIRSAAGLGRLSGEDDPDEYEKGFLHCDLLVIGGGPAGLMAALTAGRAGANVILADEDCRFGGRLNVEQEDVDAFKLDSVDLGRGGQVQHRVEVERRLCARRSLAHQAGPHGVMKFHGKSLLVFSVQEDDDFSDSCRRPWRGRPDLPRGRSSGGLRGAR